MRILVEGKTGGDRMRYTFDLYDEYDPETGVHSMARTTGYTATMAVRMLAAGLFTETGITVPEFLGKDKKIVDFILSGLEKRNIVYQQKVEKL
jgi:saccharopine dehydrogenase-like NADP-dependent oxidoreductase